jgi:putative methyltransferase
MSGRTHVTALISEPQSFQGMVYLPYMWAILKSACDRTPDLEGRVDWLDPIFMKGSPESLLAPHRDRPLDVLGLSCYTWNWDLQRAIAALAKAMNPECLVVAGGPHPDYKDPAFFSMHPFIDAVVVKDGEIPFSRILAGLLRGERDLDAIPGLYLPGGPDGHRFTGAAEVPTRFEHSPYVDQAAYYERLVERSGGRHFEAIWETNRGCPYSCNFCDWGSATMSKVRQFDIGRVRAEIEWFARMQVNGLMLADANFGILPRDPEIADFLNETRVRYGFPRFVHYSPAKNNPERTVAIARKFVASGISPVHTFAVQHTDVGVLAAADRANISVAKQRQVAKAVVSDDIPTLVQLIVGIPGDTYELWKACLTDLMDWGLHDNYQIFNYALLPNAPAADKAFLRRWNVGTISRYLPKEGTGQRRSDDTDALTKVDLIVESTSFSRTDWVRMKVYAALVRALHSLGFVRLPAMYLHFSHAVAYREFYDRLIEDHFAGSPIHRRLTSHFQHFLDDERAVEDVAFDEIASPRLSFEAGRWAFVALSWEFDRHYDELRAFLEAAYPNAPHVGSALDFQRNVMIRPDYDQQAGASFSIDRDWLTYRERARRLTEFARMPEPDPVTGRVVVRDASADLDWTGRDSMGRWLAWLDYTRELRRTLSTAFRDLRVEPTTVGA